MISGMAEPHKVSPPWQRESAVPVTVIAGSFEAQPEGLVFQCRHGEKIIKCSIADVALHDLICFHRIKKTEDKPYRVLLPEIERLVNAKYDAGRFEEDGGIVVRSVDLLRYGFKGRAKSAA
jgi:hypothetical protein